MSQDDRMNEARIIDGHAVAAGILSDVRQRVAVLMARGQKIQIASISIGDSDAVRRYVANQARAAREVGIEFDDVHLPESTTADVALSKIEQINADNNVTGVILQRPVPGPHSIQDLQSCIWADKDVEGMHPWTIGRIAYGNYSFGPCTALAAVELLCSTGLSIQGQEIVVIGHSIIVGKPIAFILMEEGATVTVCHHMTRDMRAHARRADVVFVAVGKAGLVSGDMLKPGATLIDIGINYSLDGTGRARLVGDADFASCKQTAGWITPVPGGVGPVTVAMLMRNAVALAEKNDFEWSEQSMYGSAML